MPVLSPAQRMKVDRLGRVDGVYEALRVVERIDGHNFALDVLAEMKLKLVNRQREGRPF